MVACHASHTCAQSHPAIRAMCNCAACHALCLYIFYRVFKSRKSFSFPASCPDFHHIVLYNIVYWKPTSIQIMENIPLTSRVDIRILLKERASQETDFLQPSPATTRGFKSTLECDRHRERPREILTRRSRDVQVHKVHTQSEMHNMQFSQEICYLVTCK